MNVLAIGNSFSEDSARYLHSIAKADNTKLDVVNLFIGGCSLERHYRNMLSDKKAYELQYNGVSTHFQVSLSEALLNRHWDVITLQQVSSSSFNEESYYPYITELAAYARKFAPTAKIYIHQTWAYEDGSDRLMNTKKYSKADDMLADIIAAYNKAEDSINADGIIRSGELFATLLQNGIQSVHRDSLHASYGLGRYALGLLWYQELCKKSVVDNTFADFDETVSAEDIRTVKKCVECFIHKMPI